jgi:hypothetical protein
VPAATPVITPVLELTVATDGVPELYVPPVVVLEKVVVLPTQTVFVPVKAVTVGNALTVTVRVAEHPLLLV